LPCFFFFFFFVKGLFWFNDIFGKHPLGLFW
jgi:hypothetical protein